MVRQETFEKAPGLGISIRTRANLQAILNRPNYCPVIVQQLVNHASRNLTAGGFSLQPGELKEFRHRAHGIASNGLHPLRNVINHIR